MAWRAEIGSPRCIVNLVKRVTPAQRQDDAIVGLPPALPAQAADGNGSESRGHQSLCRIQYQPIRWAAATATNPVAGAGMPG